MCRNDKVTTAGHHRQRGCTVRAIAAAFPPHAKDSSDFIVAIHFRKKQHLRLGLDLFG
jgi:hypothetical protein